MNQSPDTNNSHETAQYPNTIPEGLSKASQQILKKFSLDGYEWDVVNTEDPRRPYGFTFHMPEDEASQLSSPGQVSRDWLKKRGFTFNTLREIGPMMLDGLPFSDSSLSSTDDKNAIADVDYLPNQLIEELDPRSEFYGSIHADGYSIFADYPGEPINFRIRGQQKHSRQSGLVFYRHDQVAPRLVPFYIEKAPRFIWQIMISRHLQALTRKPGAIPDPIISIARNLGYSDITVDHPDPDMTKHRMIEDITMLMHKYATQNKDIPVFDEHDLGHLGTCMVFPATGSQAVFWLDSHFPHQREWLTNLRYPETHGRNTISQATVFVDTLNPDTVVSPEFLPD